LGPGPDEVGQKGLKLHHLLTSLTKNPKPKTKKKFFHCRLEDLPSLEGLNSSPAQLAEELWTCKQLDLQQLQALALLQAV